MSLDKSYLIDTTRSEKAKTNTERFLIAEMDYAFNRGS